MPIYEILLYVCIGAPSYYFELLDRLQKKICRTFIPFLAVSLEPLAHRLNLASLSVLYSYYFGRCSSELTQLVTLSFSQGRSSCCSDRLHDFLPPFLDVTRMVMSTVSFLAQLDSGTLCL